MAGIDKLGMNTVFNRVQQNTNLYRFLTFISGVLYLVFGYVNHYKLGFESIQILKQRIVVATLFFLVVGFSYLLKAVKENLYHFMHFFCYACLAHFYYIGTTCGFVFDHTLGMFATYIVTCIFIENIKQLYVFVLYNITLLIVAVMLTDQLLMNGQTLVAIHLMLSIGLAFMIGNQLKNREIIDKSQANLLAIFNNSHQTITLMDLDYKILKFNQKAQEVSTKFGKKEIEVGDNFFDFVSEQAKENYLSHLERCKQGVEVAYESVVYGANNEKLYYEFRFTPIYSSGNEIFAIAYFTLDITEKRDSLNQLITSKNNLELIFNSSPVPLVITRVSDSKIITANKAMMKLMAYPYNAFDHLDGSVFYSDINDRAIIREQIAKSGYIENFEFEIVKYNHQKFWGLLSGTIFQYNDEACLLLSINDITERKQIENEIIKSKNAAEDALKIKSQFLSVMSHEIRTPMNAVIGIAELLLENDPREDQIQNLKTLKFSSNNLLSIINEILDFSKIEAGKIELEHIPINLSELLDDVRLSFETAAVNKKIKLLLHVDSKINSPVLGDSVRLAQVLTNLIGNAIKFTKEGEVRIIVDQLANNDRSTELLFKIEDTGEGIEADKIDAIFESFTQASSETTRKFGGTGLGLTITRKLLELMGSNIQVTSEYGKGSCFYFKLNFDVLQNSVEEEVKTKKTDYNFDGIKILVAEDNDVNILILSQFLKKWGIMYDVAYNGLEAVQMVEKFDYDLVLMDMQMPELDGIEASLEIRQKGGKYLDLKIIVLSAAVESEIKKQMQAAHINDYIPKPFVPEQLLQKIVINTLLKA